MTENRPLKKAPRQSVLSDEIYRVIRAKIFDHEIAPGQRVNIDALAIQLEVSHTPIRESLARLESEGLILKEPLKGYSATNLLTMKEFHDLFEFRLLVEPWSAERAALSIDDAGAKDLKEEIKAAHDALKLKGYEQIQALTEHDARFHLLISRMSGNETVRRVFEGTHCHLHLFRLFLAAKNNKQLVPETRTKFIQDFFDHYYQSESGQLALQQHEEISRAIIEKNAPLARSTMYAHIEASIRAYSPAVNTQP
ncbi:MAG TPA: GntR family transcriptional regulator [Candidatus Paceibacterota bacterium]|nr:GntR family transcriptional regulator [Candidatus Paceibacterota bacterium]